MAVQIYNSLSKKKEAIPSPEQNKTILMYACGVTVYDLCHIGHARSLYIFDVIRRYLEYRGYYVNFIRNITDVDDKIINRARELNKTFEEIVEENIDAYQKDLVAMELDPVDKEPRATQNIDDMIDHISQLMDKGLAYEIEGDVYFCVRKFSDYGKLSGQSVDKMREAVRIDPDDKKKDPLDFALWKKSEEGEKSWPSPWGQGRPGWHIECSCMSMKYLNTPTLDIHAGGRDLIFPHHENEIAQSESLTGKPFARTWIHHGLLTINGQKMAKSSGNFITIQDALEKYGADSLKYFFLSSHYASPIDFSEQKMEEVKKSLERINIFLCKSELIEGERDSEIAEEIAEGRQAFLDSMDDDFNTPKALSVLFDTLHYSNKLMEDDGDDNNSAISHAFVLIKDIIDIFGLHEFQTANEDSLDSECEALLAQRKQARAEKNFKRSDELRDILRGKGIIVEDSKDGQNWRKV